MNKRQSVRDLWVTGEIWRLPLGSHLNCVKWGKGTKTRHCAGAWRGFIKDSRLPLLSVTRLVRWATQTQGGWVEFWYFGPGFNFLLLHILSKVLSPTSLILPSKPPPHTHTLSPTCYPSCNLTLIRFMQEYKSFITLCWGPGHCHAAHFMGQL